MQHKSFTSSVQLVYYVMFILFAAVAIPHYAVDLLEKLHIDVPKRLPFKGTDVMLVNVTAAAAFLILRIVTRAPFSARFWPYAAACDAALHIRNLVVIYAHKDPQVATLAEIANLLGMILLVISLLDQQHRRPPAETP
jgi:hypothetical protein